MSALRPSHGPNRTPWWMWWLAAASGLVLYLLKPGEFIQLLQALASALLAVSLLLFVLRHPVELRELLRSLARHGGQLEGPGVKLTLRSEEDIRSELAETEPAVSRMIGEPGMDGDRSVVREQE